MNAILAPLPPLPDALHQRRTPGSARRRRIGDHVIDAEALQHFNDLLEQLDLKFGPLDRDQLASAARELVDRPPHGGAPPCIRQRMRRAASIDRMLGDPDWHSHDTAASIAAHVVGYLRGQQSLIPNTLPVVGRLDDVIVVEASWPAVAQEVRDYLEFCRIRHIEAGLRGEPRRFFGFGRQDWLAAVTAESAWKTHCQRVGRSSYLPTQVNGFRIT